LIIEIPGNIAIIGVLKVALPVEDAALIVIMLVLSELWSLIKNAFGSLPRYMIHGFSS